MNYNGEKIMRKPLLILLVILFLVAGCEEKAVQTPADGIIPAVHTPVDYTILVDNSASIKGYERILVRDAIKLFINLMDNNDHVSIISFGKGAEIIGSEEMSPDNKEKLNQAIDNKIDFHHQFSDIRAGLKLLSQSKDSLFRSSGNLRMAIVFSDGYLETPGRKDGIAYKEILELKDRDLQDVLFQCLGFGKNTLDKKIDNTQNITSRILLKDKIAGSTGRFKAIMDISELAGSFIDIIKQTKELPEVFEKISPVFSLDSTINNVTVIIPKRDQNGKRLFDDALLEIISPEKTSVSFVNKHGQKNIRWEEKYESVDVIKINKPQTGIWTINLKNGSLPSFHVLVRTDLELRAQLSENYFENQEIAFTPYLYDRVSGTIKKTPSKFNVAINNKQYFGVQEKDSLCKIVIADLKPGEYSVKFKAEIPSEEYFTRVSQEYKVTILPKIFDFSNPDYEKYFRIPFFSNPLTFKAKLNTDKFQITDAHIINFVRDSNRQPVKNFLITADYNQNSASVDFFPDLKGDFTSQLKLTLKDNNNIKSSVLLPNIRYTVIDLRLHFWIAVAVLTFLMFLTVRFLLCKFSFDVVTRQGRNKKIISISNKNTYSFSFDELLDNENIKILIFCRKTPLRCSKMPWIKVSAPSKVTIDGDEPYPGIKIGHGSQIKINLKPDPLRISFK